LAYISLTVGIHKSNLDIHLALKNNKTKRRETKFNKTTRDNDSVDGMKALDVNVGATLGRNNNTVDVNLTTGPQSDEELVFLNSSTRLLTT